MPSKAAYARHRGVSRNRISVWKSRGLIIFDADGGVNFDESDKMIAGHGGRLSALPGARTEAEPVTLGAPFADTAAAAGVDGLPSKLESERVRTCYEAKLLQLRYERESAQVAIIDDVVSMIVGEYARVRDRLATIGERVAPQLTDMGSAELVKAAIDGDVVTALEDLTGG